MRYKLWAKRAHFMKEYNPINSELAVGPKEPKRKVMGAQNAAIDLTSPLVSRCTIC